MADFESFGAVEDSGQVDAASFEKFKERIKASQTQIKALKKGEQKVRQKEEKLIKILTKFVKNHQKKDVMLLVARLLEQNIPPIFILSIVLLGNEDVLEDPESKKLLSRPEDLPEADYVSLAKYDKDELLPIKLKVRIDDWLKNILKSALENPNRLIKTVYDEDEQIKLPLIQLCAFILRDYLEANEEEADYEKLKEFSAFFMSGILKKVNDKLKSTKELEEKEES